MANIRAKLFRNDLSRLSVLSVPLKNDSEKIKIAVYRNHSFEMVASALNSFLDFSDLNAEFIYSGYDDSLSFGEYEKDADIDILWLDMSRYKNIDIINWLEERIKFLKKVSKAKTVLYHTGEYDLSGVKAPDLIISDASAVEKILGKDTFDPEKTVFSGTRFSAKACLYIAREIGFRYIPTLVKPQLKAVITDLDNTFYEGVIAEDGIESIIPNKRYQKKLKDLKNKGFLVAVSSKNDINDVKKCFAERKDFLFAFEDFDAFEISWAPKSEAVGKIAGKFNIGADSCLFIDDNIGEIESVKAVFPGIKIIEAGDEENVCNMLDYYPGLYKTEITGEDVLRSADMKANAARAEIGAGISDEEYFKRIGVTLTYEINPRGKIQRISELLNKTNQFIFSYKRYSQNEIEKLYEDPQYRVITVSMADKLSDSGLIGILIAKRADNAVESDELVISCRALGRRLEDIMIGKAFLVAADAFGTDKNAVIRYVKGERNVPAGEWLKRYIGKEISEINTVAVKNINYEGITIKEEKNESMD